MADALIEAIAKDKALPPSVLMSAAEQIAFHESKGVVDKKQESGGPGRGLFQYEQGSKDDSAAVARNRAMAAYKRYSLPVPEWLSELPEDFNPAELTKEQQYTLFFGDHRERPNSDFAKLKEMPLDEWWGKFHQTKNDEKKREVFRADQAYLLKQKMANQAKTFTNAL